MFDNALARTLDTLPEIGAMLPKRARIAIKSKGRILFIEPSEIVAVEAQGNYILVRRPGESDLLRESMTAVAEKLRAYGFVRIHRSVIVNAAFVEEIVPMSDGDSMLRMQGGMEFKVSRTYKKNLRSITPLWIGTSGFRGS
jgi:two-component system, LytTR family, response regulator